MTVLGMGRPTRVLSRVVSILVQVGQLSQRDRAAGWVIMARNRRLELGDNILRTLQVYLQLL